MHIYGITYSEASKNKVEFIDADSMLGALKRFKATFPAKVVVTIWLSGTSSD